MRTILFKTLILIISIGLSSCEKDNSNEDVVTNNSGDFYFKAKIDGQDFSADMKSCECSTPADYLTETYKHNGNLYIKAKKNTSNAGEGEFWMAIGSVSSPYSGAGVYELIPQKDPYVGASYTLNLEKWVVGDEFLGIENGQPIYSTTTGTITITKDENKIIEGTFQFEGLNKTKQSTKQFKDGKFRLKVK